MQLVDVTGIVNTDDGLHYYIIRNNDKAVYVDSANCEYDVIKSSLEFDNWIISDYSVMWTMGEYIGEFDTLEEIIDYINFNTLLVS